MRSLAIICGLFMIFGGAISAQSQSEYRVETVVSGLDQPWSVAFLPNGEYLITSRPGALHRVTAAGEIQPALANTPATYYHGQGGYFDVVLDPDFENNQTVYLSFAHGEPTANATRIVRGVLGETVLENVEPIFTTNSLKDTGAHYGGRMAFLPDGTLLLTTGDGFQYRDAAQDKGNEMGKVIRINRDGSVPSDNPFAQNADAARVFSYGHRNPQGLAVDTASGTVYQHEHGPKGGDEINVITAGVNYGWPAATHGINYSGARVSPFTSLANMQDAIKVWTPSIAPSGLAVYRGTQFSEWDGDLLVGALVNQEVRHLKVEDGQIVSEQAVFPEIKARIRDVRVAPSGAIYVLTDGANATLYRVSATPNTANAIE